MIKLVAAYNANRTLKNAQKIRAYARAHPMSVCMLLPAERDLVADAIHHANKGEA